MRLITVVLLAALTGATLEGCGREAPPQQTAAPDPLAPAVTVPPLPAPAAQPEAPPVPAEAPAPEEAAPAEAPAPPRDPAELHQALVGTAWRIGDMEIAFLDEKKVFAKGGMVADLTLEGLTASYALDNGVITATAAGRTLTAEWDGQKLRVAGKEAVRTR